MNFWDLPISPNLQHWRGDVLGATTPSFFIRVLGIKTQVLMLGQRAFYWQNPLLGCTNLDFNSITIQQQETAFHWGLPAWRPLDNGFSISTWFGRPCWEAWTFSYRNCGQKTKTWWMVTDSKISNKLSSSAARVSARQSCQTTLAYGRMCTWNVSAENWGRSEFDHFSLVTGQEVFLVILIP